MCESKDDWCFFFFSSRRRHTRFDCDWSSDVCSSDLALLLSREERLEHVGLGFFAHPDAGVRDREHHKRARAGRVVVGGVRDRKSVVEGKRVDLGGRRIIKKKKKKKCTDE